MKSTILMGLCAAVFMVGCDTADVANAPQERLRTQLDFAELFGKRLKFNDTDYTVINADKTVGGEFGGVALAGRWELRDDYWCRRLTAGPSGPQPEDCQEFIKIGNSIKVTRDRGLGAVFYYTIE